MRLTQRRSVLAAGLPSTAAKARSGQSSPGVRRALSLLLLPIGFFAGLQRTPGLEVAQGSEAGVHGPEPMAVVGDACEQEGRPRTATLHRKPSRKVERPFLTRPVDLYEPSDAQAEQRYHEQQSKELVDVLRERVDIQRLAFPDQSAEAVATPVFTYMTGLLDGVIRTAPDLADELAEQIESSMCDPQARDEHLIALAQMISLTPELANEETFDCLFSIHTRGQENAVLWFGLDAWKASGLPKSNAIAEIEADASDARTLRRFLTLQELMDAAGEARGETLQPDPVGPSASAAVAGLGAD
ncbi:MAG: hypothetical protein OXU20_22615 [Myxococcales bacterium]|nr:hypothetical protein [Myxococcales bacterium]MDD9967673.1 hypothetical protein [Myxococcales bacterium]